MKRNILKHTVIAMFATFMVPGAFCQITENFAFVKARNSPSVEQVYDAGTFGEEKANAVKIRVMRSFIKEFRDVENVTWLRAIDGGYVAQFMIDSVQTSVGYSIGGTWNYTLKRYAEKKMAVDLRTLVKRVFFDYAIMEVVEITQPNQEGNILYRVMIKNEENFKILRIYNDEMQIAGDYTTP